MKCCYRIMLSGVLSLLEMKYLIYGIPKTHNAYHKPVLQNKNGHVLRMTPETVKYNPYGVNEKA